MLEVMRRQVVRRLRPTYNRLRQGDALRIGPFSIAWAPYLLQLRHRVEVVERRLAELESGQSPKAAGEPARRSVVFLHQSYYNFFYLARALRARGFDAISVSLEGPDSPYAPFYHGEDVSLYDPDPARSAAKVEEFLALIPGRFRMAHFYGKGHMGLSPESIDYGERYDAIPWEFLNFRRRGMKIGYSIGGCLDGISQSSFFKWSGGCCNKCVWQHEPEYCSDLRNLAWGHKVQMLCDLIATEGNPALDYQSGPKTYREPLTTALDPEVWNPDLPIPEQLRLKRECSEVVVFHAVGNVKLRSVGGRNIKGTPAIEAAVERLRSEGVKIRLEFVTAMPNLELRFIQAQADVVIDQINYGRYGATGREGLMLGKPTVCYINTRENHPRDELQSLKECPLVSANEKTIYPVLKDLAANLDRRRAIGAASRAYALKWHSAEACAQRFERVYDRLIAGLPPAG